MALGLASRERAGVGGRRAHSLLGLTPPLDQSYRESRFSGRFATGETRRLRLTRRGRKARGRAVPGTAALPGAHAKRASAGRDARTGYLVPIPFVARSRQKQREARQDTTVKQSHAACGSDQNQSQIRLLAIPGKDGSGRSAGRLPRPPQRRSLARTNNPLLESQKIQCNSSLAHCHKGCRLCKRPGHHLTPPQSTRHPRQGPRNNRSPRPAAQHPLRRHTRGMRSKAHQINRHHLPRHRPPFTISPARAVGRWGSMG
jgi:hypothetical protein